MSVERASQPRFRRPTQPPSIALTEDDFALLQRIHAHRFIRTSDLYRLFPHRTSDKLSRRLARLYRTGFVDRPVAQIDFYRGGGSQPLVYGLDVAGVRALAARGHTKAPRDIRIRNRRYTRENLDHTTTTAAAVVDVEVGCMTHPDLTFLPIPPRPDGWSVKLPWRGQEAQVQIVPDALFGLSRSSEGRDLRSYFFLELDRGSMTVVPTEAVRESQAFLYRSSILRKLFAYGVSHKQDLHQRHLGIHAARVLFLTTNAHRAEEMRIAAERFILRQMGLPAGLFLFGTYGNAGQPVLSLPLQDASGMALSLDQPPLSVP